MSNKTQKDADAKTVLARRNHVTFKFIFYTLLLIATVLVSAYLFIDDNTKPAQNAPVIAKNKCLKMASEYKCLALLEVADTDQLRIKGLSGRESMPIDRGMLFTSEVEETQCFWMQGMRFELDFVWLDSEKQIIKTNSNVSPDTYPHQYCTDNVQYVIELNGGYSTTSGLHLGQKLDF